MSQTTKRVFTHKSKLFLVLASMILVLSCKNPLGDESGGSGGAGGAGGGGGSGGGETIGSNYILPKGSLSQEEQKKILDPNKNFKVLFERVSGGKYWPLHEIKIIMLTKIKNNFDLWVKTLFVVWDIISSIKLNFL